MQRCLLVVPTGSGVGLTSVGLGILRALERQGVDAGFARPLRMRAGPDPTGALLQTVAHRAPPSSIDRDTTEALLAEGEDEQLLEQVVSLVESAGQDVSVVVVEGCVPVQGVEYATRLNVAMAAALDAELVVVGAPELDDPDQVARWFDVACQPYAGRTVSCIVNRVRLAEVEQPRSGAFLGDGQLVPAAVFQHWSTAFVDAGLDLVGLVPHLDVLSQPRVADVVRALDAEILHAGDLNRRVADVAVCAASLGYAVSFLGAGTLAVVPADRDDMLAGLALATLGGLELAGVVLSIDQDVSPAMMTLCAPALEGGLPVIASHRDSYTTATAIHSIQMEMGPEDAPLAELSMNVVANHLQASWSRAQAENIRARRMTTSAFRYTLVKRAQKADKRIVLPEGDEPRTLRAAAICARRRIARCVLLGPPDLIRTAARKASVELPDDGIEIVDPHDVARRYVDGMVTRRAHKGLTHDQAVDQLKDRGVLGTMMVAEGDADGLVSGAVHSTAHTIRPALKLIRTAPDASLVSSVFFMCLPDQVLVYGDCAVNPDPNAAQLAEIALQSADSAVAFGIEPRVAMISYSTRRSGDGAAVDKVAEATRLAKEKRPDLLIDGPLQYDAAAIASVAAKKAPGSEVAGRATVFVFPDLNTGNTTYKAVQRSANVVSMGPLLQGLAKPVNDLSRGASVEDIVFTIALTAVQAASS